LKQLYRIREKIQGMTAGEIAGDVLLRAQRRFTRAISLAIDSPQTAYVSDESLRRSLDGKTITEVALRLRENRQPRARSAGSPPCQVAASQIRCVPDQKTRMMRRPEV
jgi:hypothetical protein